MRAPVDSAKIHELARRLSKLTQADVRIYLTGGATAVLEGWRASTIDVDLRLDPETDELLRELPKLKNELDINIELAAPPDFIPELPGWRERSPLVFESGNVSVYHFDLYSQALSKIERGFTQDLADVKKMVEGGLIKTERVRELFESIEPDLYRYPAIDPQAFRDKVNRAMGT